jgi:hypothetical protein
VRVVDVRQDETRLRPDVFLRAPEALQRQRLAAVVVRRARQVNVANGPQVDVAG